MRKLTIPFWLLTLVALYGCGGSSSDTRDASASSSSSSASGSGSSSSQALNENWRLVWRDEFDGEAIDADKWHFEENCVGGGNNELQCYTARPENAYVADGYLNIVAREETYRGPGRWDDDPAYDPGDTSVQRDYTSARLRSKGKGDFTYGRVEIRAKLPQGQGIWPALWMLPTESVYGGWPRSGEIDILEAINSNGTGGNEIHGTLHYGSAWPDNRYSGTSYEPSTRVWEDFHTYAVEWSEGEIHWFVDETHYATQTSAGWFTYYEGAPGEGFVFGQGAAPFDQAFHLIMNLAVGGNWPGAPDESTEFPQSLQVDYVRVYECALDPATGKGCSDRLDEQIAPLAGHPAPARQSYWLYRDGVASVSLAAPAGEVETGLEAESDQAQSGNLIVDFAAATDSGSKVLSAEFLGPANLFLAVAEPAADGFEPAVNLSPLAQTGQLAFDILVEEKSEDARFLIKVDSGWPALSFVQIDPPVGEWTRWAVRLNQLQPNDTETGQVNLNRVINPFVFEVAAGTAKVKLNNIAYECLAECAPQAILSGQSERIDAPHSVFDDAIDANWDLGLGIYETAAGHVTATVVGAEESGRGQVIDVRFGDSAASGIAFIQASTTRDMSALAGGILSFDIRVLDYGAASAMAVRADCQYPCSSGDMDLGMVGAGGWETVEIPVADLTAGGLDLTKVNTPFVISPSWESQAGVHLQLDNIRYRLP